MMRFIDISHWQEGIDLPSLFPQIDACVCKATEGIGLVDKCCDKFIQTLIKVGKQWGFYHFARNGDPIMEADFFIRNTRNYFNHGIPILDWEGEQSVEWVNRFVRRIHDVTGIWPWIYANPWRFDQGGVEPNCMRWVAAYPAYSHPTFEMAEGWEAPEADGLVGAWQFCSDLRLDGYSGNLDGDLFYGDEEAWARYAGDVGQDNDDNPDDGSGDDGHVPDSQTLENETYKITIERK